MATAEKKKSSKKVKKETPKAEIKPALTPEEIEVLQAEVTSLNEKVSTLENTVKEEQDKRVRALAELENFRKRKELEVMNFKKYAAEKALLEMLPIIDSVELACAHANTDGSQQKTLLEGVNLIQKQFKSALEKLGVRPIEALNNKFDPNFHQAISQEEHKDIESDTVVKEMQKGYMLEDKVLRASMVVVSI